MLRFAEWLGTNEKAPYVYHITYLRNMDMIAAGKLIPRGGTSAWLKPHLQQHSAKGVFFSSTPQGAEYWVELLIEQANSLSDYPIEEEFVPVILRFKLNRNSWTPDDLGNAEIKHNFFTKKNIHNAGLEIWDGRQWTQDLSAGENIKHYFGDEDEFYYQNYPLPNEWAKSSMSNTYSRRRLA